MKIEFLINNTGELYSFKTSNEEEEIEEFRIPSIVNGIKVESIADLRSTFLDLYTHGVKKIKKLIIENGIKKIASFAFGAKDIEIDTVYWAKSCTVIPSFCFDSSNIRNVEGIEHVYKIEPWAFYSTQLKRFSWPPKCKEIPDGCFARCKSFSQINGIEGVTHIGYGAFSGTAISTFCWPEGVSTTEKADFLIDCKKLKEIKFLENGVRTIDLKCFSLLKGSKKIKVSCCAINLLNTKKYSKIKDRLILPYYVTEVS